jgi:hypothetical protein
MMDQADEDPQRYPHGWLAQADTGQHGMDKAVSAHRRQLRSRLRRLAVVATTVTVALAILVISGGERSAPPKPGSSRALGAAREISTLLADIPQSANTLGQPTAMLTLRWYGDLECPFCREFALGALPSIISRWVRDGRLKIEYLSMETATRSPSVFQLQQVAALAAGMQDKMWNFIELFYHEQGEEDSGYVTERYLNGLASQIPGLNVTLWREDRFDPELASLVAAERRAARLHHFRGTPTFLIGQTDGTIYKLKARSLTEPKFFAGAIEYLLSRSADKAR